MNSSTNNNSMTLFNLLSQDIVESMQHSTYFTDMITMLNNLFSSTKSLTRNYQNYLSSLENPTRKDKYHYLGNELINICKLYVNRHDCEKTQCIAITRKKQQCLNKCNGQFCYVHLLKAKKAEGNTKIDTVYNCTDILQSVSTSSPYKGITKKGLPCKRKSKSMYCYHHKIQSNTTASTETSSSPPPEITLSPKQCTTDNSTRFNDKTVDIIEMIGRYERLSLSPVKRPLPKTDKDFRFLYKLTSLVDSESKQICAIYKSRLESLSCYLNNLDDIDLNDFDKETDSIISFVRDDNTKTINAFLSN